MRDPKPINLMTDDYWRELGWPVVARDSDGHTITMYAEVDGDDFNEWLRECFDNDLTVTKLIRAKAEGGQS